MNHAANKSVVAVVCVIVCFLFGVQSQQKPASTSDPGARGIDLYLQGDMEGAVKVLREAVKSRKEDSKSWHYLGMAFSGQGNLTEASKAFRKAVDLRYTAFNKEFSFQEEEVSENQLLRLKALAQELIESQKKHLEMFAAHQAVEKEQLALERSQIQAACMDQHTRLVGGHNTLKMSDMKIRKIRVLNRPEPIFPKGANRMNGTVVLKAIVAPDGSVRHIELIRSPGDAFTEEAMKAALKTRVQPASICGKVVGSPLLLEYDFNLGG